LQPLLRPLQPRIAYIEHSTGQTRDQIRNQAQPWRAWYVGRRWRRLRRQILVRDLFTCQLCKRIGFDTSKLVADHKTPHHGSTRLFWDAANIQCLCAECHNSVKQSEERRGLWI
jgi:5-methylcytosine-specific restriction endonuclease McrA